MDQPIDFVSLVLRLEQQDFISQCPFPFLLAVNGALTNAPLTNGPSAETDGFEPNTVLFDEEPEAPGARPVSDRPIVHAVRKLNPLIPQAIILGRASASDIVIADPQVSKTHALFQGADASWELSDAGSRNGTWVGNRRLKPRGDAAAVQSCDILSFGHRAYLFLDAGDCWQQVRDLTR